MVDLEVRIISDPHHVTEAHWGGLATQGNPFASREFHTALYAAGCTGADTGWEPRFVGLYDAAGALHALAPAYLKRHSYGEYVFDWSWANAYQRAGLSYYPKLVVAAPFSPVTGPRLWLAKGSANQAGLRQRLSEALIDHGKASSVSSIHWLFPLEEEARALGEHGLLLRTGCQFHWENQNYEDFDAYLAQFASKKRKNIKRERRRVVEAGIDVSVLSGEEISEAQWALFHRFYLGTCYKRGGSPYLNESFFQRLGKALPQNVMLVRARDGDRVVAAALFLRSADTLFGRYWGSDREYDSLHFECCYYRPIEYCIEKRIRRFEAGAQGEHKLSRGLLPQTTWSAHWLAHPEFARAVGDYLEHERRDIADYMELLDSHAPFKQNND